MRRVHTACSLIAWIMSLLLTQDEGGVECLDSHTGSPFIVNPSQPKLGIRDW